MKVEWLLLGLLISGVAVGETQHNMESPQLNASSVVASIQFDFDATKLASYDITVLRQLASLIEKHPSVKIILTGNTDSVGNEKYNHKLGLARAKSAAVFLEREFGISQQNMLVRTRGEMDPIASNKTKQGRELNRRVDIYLPKLVVKAN